MGVSQKYRGPNTQSVDMLKFELLDFRRKPTSNSEVSFLGHIPIPMSQQHPLGRPHSEGSSRSCSAAKRERNGGSKGLPLMCQRNHARIVSQQMPTCTMKVSKHINPLVRQKMQNRQWNDISREVELLKGGQITDQILPGYHHELAESRVYMLSVGVTT